VTNLEPTFRQKDSGGSGGAPAATPAVAIQKSRKSRTLKPPQIRTQKGGGEKKDISGEAHHSTIKPKIDDRDSSNLRIGSRKGKVEAET